MAAEVPVAWVARDTALHREEPPQYIQAASEASLTITAAVSFVTFNS